MAPLCPSPGRVRPDWLTSFVKLPRSAGEELRSVVFSPSATPSGSRPGLVRPDRESDDLDSLPPVESLEAALIDTFRMPPVISTLGRSLSAASSRRILGANDRIGVGLIGCGVRGLGVGAYVRQAGGAEIRGVTDAYVPRRERAAEEFGETATSITNYGDLLERNDIDAVVIATPDHWHAPMCTEAVQAGKDVYLEKPVTHRLEEGDALVRAVEESGRVVATGTQQRSWSHFLEAKELIEQGVLGRVTYVRCYWFQDYSRFRAGLAQRVDERQLDWKLWLGPAPRQPFDATKFQFWRFFWDFGGGSVTDLMTHWIDVVQWFLNSPAAAEVQAVGATYVQDWLEAPDTVVATIQFPDGYMAVYEGNMTCGLLGCGIEFRGDRAMMTINRVGYAVYEEGTRPLEAVSLPDPIHRFARSDDTSRIERVDGSGTLDNVRNWLNCVRGRDIPHAHIRAGVESAATSHRVNKAIRENRAIRIEN